MYGWVLKIGGPQKDTSFLSYLSCLVLHGMFWFEGSRVGRSTSSTPRGEPHGNWLSTLWLITLWFYFKHMCFLEGDLGPSWPFWGVLFWRFWPTKIWACQDTVGVQGSFGFKGKVQGAPKKMAFPPSTNNLSGWVAKWQHLLHKVWWNQCENWSMCKTSNQRET